MPLLHEPVAYSRQTAMQWCHKGKSPPFLELKGCSAFCSSHTDPVLDEARKSTDICRTDLPAEYLCLEGHEMHEQAFCCKQIDHLKGA